MSDVKRCTKCGEERPLARFAPNPKMKSGKESVCNLCKAAYLKNRYKTDPEFRAKVSKYKSEFWLKKKYGLTPEQFEELFEKQGRKCALCGTEDHGRTGEHQKSRWNVDHDHETGRVRGVLCHHCNVSLGHYERLRKLIGPTNLAAYLIGDIS